MQSAKSMLIFDQSKRSSCSTSHTLPRVNPLATIGDAIASFLDEKDPITAEMGPVSVHNVKKSHHIGPITWSDRRWRWKDATSKKRRATTLILYVTCPKAPSDKLTLTRFTIAIGTVLGLLIWAIREINFVSATNTSAVFNFGFGAVDARALMSSASLPTNMASLALIANLPQLILSFLYFAYNGLFTAMLGTYEWMSYAHKKKGLRLSRKPSGAQRSTYFLQLPYRFGVPLVVLSGMLHWLVSQSIFVVAFDVYDDRGELQTTGIGWEHDAVTRTCGYSPIAMLAVVVLGVAMLVAVLAFGYIPYKHGMPLAGSCSLAISAVCHPDMQSSVGDAAMSEEKLQWGVVSTGVDGIGHCAFSNEDVGPMIKGRMYV